MENKATAQSQPDSGPGAVAMESNGNLKPINHSGSILKIPKEDMNQFQQEQQQPPQQKSRETDSVSSHNSCSSTASSTARSKRKTNAAVSTAGLILLLGTATAAAFLGVGISAASKEQEDQFERAAADTTNNIRDAFEDYVNAVGMVHARCRMRTFSRQDFRDTYEYLIDKTKNGGEGLQFKAVQFYPNITNAERPELEADSRAFYSQHYPNVNYSGIVGFNNLNASGGLQPRKEEPWYFPVHWMEPVAGNEAAIDLDYHSSEVRVRAVRALFANAAPSLSDRLSLVQTAGTVSRCGDHDGPSYGVVLSHPGVNLTRTSTVDGGAFGNLDDYGYAFNGTNTTGTTSAATSSLNHMAKGFIDDVWPRDIAAMVVCIPDLMKRSTIDQSKSSAVYIHDLNHLSNDPVFMGGAIIEGNGDTRPDVSFVDEVDLEDLKSPSRFVNLKRQANVTAANRVWTITVVALENTYKPNIVFVVLGGSIIFVCTCVVAIWVYSNSQRIDKWNEMAAAAQVEKAALILQNAKQQAKTERELNDFLAHEVRNPVAAALAACNFVTVAVSQPNPLPDQASRELARDDLKIIDNALNFVNDLLRNMLDMHRAASKQLQVTMVATDLLHDVIEPVAGMLHRRGSKIKLITECPPDLVVLTDPLRLKQVILNLGRNSSKFIELGFIKLTAVVANGFVRIYVDDSGCGVPEEKHQSLFNKFQESLDVLSQGTGIGLYLCKSLVELMGGEIYLDPDYNSGIPGHLGTRFVVDLKMAPLEQAVLAADPRMLGLLNPESSKGSRAQLEGNSSSGFPLQSELPEKISVLFVDDDPILRKLFVRTTKTVAPNWVIREASNGETALRLTEQGEQFDLIFCDMYMASVEKQLLGTETVAELRQKGCKSRICGLSANDKEADFLLSGADAFMFKPFPCKKDELTEALINVLFDDEKSGCPSAGEGLAIFDS